MKKHIESNQLYLLGEAEIKLSRRYPHMMAELLFNHPSIE